MSERPDMIAAFKSRWGAVELTPDEAVQIARLALLRGRLMEGASEEAKSRLIALWHIVNLLHHQIEAGDDHR